MHEQRYCFVPGKDTQEQRYRFEPGKGMNEQRQRIVPGKGARKQQRRFMPGKNMREQRHRIVPGKMRKRSSAVSCRTRTCTSSANIPYLVRKRKDIAKHVGDMAMGFSEIETEEAARGEI
jgi:hypothetical protein